MTLFHNTTLKNGDSIMA